jgi:3-methyl-2-oxobutanoate hydroxymethyltransferase
LKISAQELLARKAAGPKIVMLTSYDYPTARLEDACGIDVQLVGDSVGTNVLGYADVSEVTVDDMVHHVKAVSKGARRSFVLCDMPYRSFATPETALDNARRFVEAGADGVKMEGEEDVLEQIRCLASSGIPVCAHIGYTPQSDGARAAVQGRDLARAQQLITVARQAQEAGAFLLVLELIPQPLSAEITRLLTIPTIGIGAGKFCDGQVQVVYDIAGLSERVFRHAKAYAHLAQEYSQLVTSYAEEIRNGSFPTEENAFTLPDEVLRGVRSWLETQQ